jgi:hypothetical protein
MKKYLLILMITFAALTFSLSSCDQDSDVSNGTGSQPAVTPPTPTEITTLQVTIDVTIDTSIAELEGKTMNDIAGVKLYYGFGIYTEETVLSRHFDVSADDMTVEKVTDTTGHVTFTIKDDDLAGTRTPYFYAEVIADNGEVLANMETALQSNEAYQKNSTHDITLHADSLYADIGLILK